MKKSLIFIVLLLSSFISGATEEGYRIITGFEATSFVPDASMVKIDDGHPLPSFVRLNGNEFIWETDFAHWFATTFKLGEGYGITELNRNIDTRNETHIRYQLSFAGIPVYDGSFVAHFTEGNLTSLNGRLYNLIDVDPLPGISEPEALETALASINAEMYKWEAAQENAWLKSFTGNPDTTYYPHGKLVLYPLKNEETTTHRLAYHFLVYAEKPLRIIEIVIDAENGYILSEIDRIQQVDVPGTAVTKYSGNQTIVADSFAQGFRLRETGRGNGVETYNMLKGTSYAAAVDFTDADNYWNNVNANKDEIATDAHWAAEKTWDYFWVKHNRNSIDGNGFKLMNYVHYDVNYANAFWDGTRMTFGDGNSSMNPLVALDIVSHEISHGLTQYTADLVYSYESGALNEAFSDIFGAAVEFYAKPASANWLMGENIGSAFRSMSNPNQYSDPDTYLGTYWYAGSNDNGGVHTNSGVLNHWFYRLSVGGTGVNDIGNSFSITGLGVDTAAKIAFRMLTVYLTNTSQYSDARFYGIQSAIDLFGECSPQVKAVTDAFYAVGIGPAYYDGVLADFATADTLSCTVPSTVYFSNKSLNGINYMWYFGDGTSSSQMNPVHVYIDSGSFNVRLTVDGGQCGTDSLVKTAYIVINPPALPSVTGDANCGPDSLLLSAAASDSIYWYDAPLGGNLLKSGPVLQTPWLTATTSYWVANSIETPSVYGSKPSNTGAGSYFNSNGSHYLVFHCTSPVILKSVKVYANTAGLRTIELRSSTGAVIQSANVYIPQGENRITLNFNVPVQNNLRLTGPSYPDLYRNSGGTAYPYAAGPFIQVIKSSATTNPTGYYYYFYDWEVQTAPCVSPRREVKAYINQYAPQAQFSQTSNGLTVSFSNQSVDGNTFNWSFGDGNTSQVKNPVHTYAQPGSYAIKLMAVNACGADSSSTLIDLYITGISVPHHNDKLLITAYPNPSTGTLNIRINSTTALRDVYDISLIDVTGRTAREWNGRFADNSEQITLDVSDLPRGLYFIRTRTAKLAGQQKIILR